MVARDVERIDCLHPFAPLRRRHRLARQPRLPLVPPALQRGRIGAFRRNRAVAFVQRCPERTEQAGKVCLLPFQRIEQRLAQCQIRFLGQAQAQLGAQAGDPVAFIARTPLFQHDAGGFVVRFVNRNNRLNQGRGQAV